MHKNLVMKKDTGNLLPWLMWGTAALFYCYQFIIRVCPSVMADDWMLSFSIDTATLGVISAFFYQAYAGMQIPLGIIIDKLGPRRLLAIAAFICASGCCLTAMTNQVELVSVGRFLMGMGAAGGFLGALKVGTMWFPPHKMGMIAGLTTGLGTLGGIFGQAPLSMLNGLIDWRGSLFILTILGVSVATLIWFIVKDSPKGTVRTSPSSDSMPLFEGLKMVVSNKQCWLIAFHGFLMYVPLAAFADLWGVPYLKSVYGFKEEYAATMVSSIYVGTIVGGLLLGPITYFFRQERLPMMMGALISCVCYVVVIFVHPLPDWLIYVLLFTGGVSFITECLCYVTSQAKAE